MKGRALTPAAKRAVMEKLLKAWEELPTMRFGQFVINACYPDDPFHLEDETICELADNLVKKTR